MGMYKTVKIEKCWCCCCGSGPECEVVEAEKAKEVAEASEVVEAAEVAKVGV